MNKWLFYIVIVALGVGCTKPTESHVVEPKKDIYTYPGEYDVDSVTNIQAYFDSICKNCGAAVWTYAYEPNGNESIEVWNAVKELHRYVNHQRKYYPAEEVTKAIEHMTLAQAYIYSQGGPKPDTVNCGEAFLFRFIEQTALHSPQLDFVTTFRAEGGKAGILYLEDWSLTHPLYCFLVYETEQGYKMIRVGDGYGYLANIYSIYQLFDEYGRTYYLCSFNERPIDFTQYLYGWDGNTMKFLCKAHSVEGAGWDIYINNSKIVFNPNKVRWDYCVLKNGVYQKLKGTKSYKMTLDWENSRFHEVTADDE